MTPCIEWNKGRNRKGYGVAYRDGRCWRAHRLAWVDAHGPIPDGLLVLHRCDNPSCVNVDHLFLGTAADNTADMIAKDRAARGEAHGMAKLTEDDVRAIYAARGIRSHRAIAAEYGVSASTVQRIHTGETWTRITSEMDDSALCAAWAWMSS